MPWRAPPISQPARQVGPSWGPLRIRMLVSVGSSEEAGPGAFGSVEIISSELQGEERGSSLGSARNLSLVMIVPRLVKKGSTWPIIRA